MTIIDRLKREPAILIAAAAMAVYTAWQVIGNDMPIDDVMTGNYMVYCLAAITAIATRLKVWANTNHDAAIEAELAKTQDQREPLEEI